MATRTGSFTWYHAPRKRVTAAHSTVGGRHLTTSDTEIGSSDGHPKQRLQYHEVHDNPTPGPY